MRQNKTVFTCVSYAEARNSYRLDVRLSVCPSVTRCHPIKTAEYIVMLSSPHDSPFILVLCVSKIFAKFRRGLPLRGRQTEVGYDKTGDISETRRVDQSIDTTCYRLSATVDCEQHTRDRPRSVYLPLILISSQMNTEKWNMNIHFHVHQPRSSSKHVLAIRILSVRPSVCHTLVLYQNG